jgi:hypothetical protein
MHESIEMQYFNTFSTKLEIKYFTRILYECNLIGSNVMTLN